MQQEGYSRQDINTGIYRNSLDFLRCEAFFANNVKFNRLNENINYSMITTIDPSAKEIKVTP